MPLVEGTKYDEGKPTYELLSSEFLDGIATVSAYGADKYEVWNWAKGIRYGRVFGAMMRHLWAFWRGEENDQETNMPHLWHAGCCLMYLSHYEVNKDRYSKFDDRFKR